MKRWFLIAAYFWVLGCVLAACSGPKAFPPTCNLTYTCGAGETCETADGNNYTCEPAGPGALGSSCTPAMASTAPCAERLTCLQVGNTATGTCTGWCDAAHPCPSDQACVLITTKFDVEVRVCSLSDPASCAFSYTCGAGQTCWTPDGVTFQCMPAGTLTLGQACDPSNTSALCADGLVCFDAGDGTGSCTAWCAADGSCPSGGSCTTLGTTYGISARVCR